MYPSSLKSVEQECGPGELRLLVHGCLETTESCNFYNFRFVHFAAFLNGLPNCSCLKLSLIDGLSALAKQFGMDGS